MRAKLEAEIEGLFWCASGNKPLEVTPSESWRKAFYDANTRTGGHDEKEVGSLFKCRQFVKESWGWRRARAAAALGRTKKLEEYIWPVRGAGQPTGVDMETRTVILVTLQGRPVLWTAHKAVSFLYEHELKDSAGAAAAATCRLKALPRCVGLNLQPPCSLEELSRALECIAISADSWIRNAQEVDSKGTLGLEVYTAVGPRITGQAPQIQAKLCARGKMVLDNFADVLKFVDRRGVVPLRLFYFEGKIAGAGRKTDFVKGQEIRVDLRMDIEKVGQGPNRLKKGSNGNQLRPELAFPKCDLVFYC